MSHSKRNTSLAFFTAHERAELRGTWGSQTTHLTRDSFLPFASCQLCLLPSRDPVSCASYGHIFCRECALRNLLAQKEEGKRGERELERRALEEGLQERVWEEEVRGREVRDFEGLQAGFEGVKKFGGAAAPAAGNTAIGEDDVKTQEGIKKRKFHFDEEAGQKLASRERESIKRQMMQEERSAKSELPSFWVPGETPSNQRKSEGKVGKVHPTCPAAENSKPHDFALRSLITVRFTEERQTSSSKESGTGEGATEDEKWEMKRMCPACHKVLSNSTKAILAKPCGHVLCKPCSARFQKVEGKSAHDVVVVGEGDGEDEQAGVVRCYVCQENVTAGWKGKGKKEKRKRDLEKKEKIVERGLVELSCEGTGFAGGGRNVVKKDGLSFQC